MSATAPFRLGHNAIGTLLRSLLADELRRLRRAQSSTPSWSDALPFGEDGIGFDSLGLRQAAGRINQFFRFSSVRSGVDLLRVQSLGALTDRVYEALRPESALAFETSGEPRLHVHPLAELAAEAQIWAERFRDRERIVSFVPAHHVYGCIWAALLPQCLNISAIDGRGWVSTELQAALAAGDLIVATPFLWQFLVRSLDGFPAGCEGVTSTAPMPQDLTADLTADLTRMGLARLTEVYGATENGASGLHGEAHLSSGLLRYALGIEDDETGERICSSFRLEG